MEDYSEVTATLNRKVTELIWLLNDKKWVEAHQNTVEIRKDLEKLIFWIFDEIDHKGHK